MDQKVRTQKRSALKKLGEILREKGLLSQQQIEQALAIQRTSGERFGRILVRQGWITENDLLDALSERFGIPRLRQIDAYAIDPAVVKLIPVEMAQRYNVIPLFRVDDLLTIAISDPLDVGAVDAVRFHTRLNVQEVLASEAEIAAAIKKYFRGDGSLERIISSVEENMVLEIEEEADLDETRIDATDEASIINFVNVILSQAIYDKASDIHCEADDKIFRIRYRIDGMLQQVTTTPLSLASMIISRIKILAELDVSEKRVPQDGRFRLKIDNREIDVRVSIIPTVNGEKAVMRLLDPRNAVLQLTDLGFSTGVLERWQQVIRKPEGIIFITGPTGSGKTTTLYSVLNTINSLSKNIITVENPVEYKLPLVNQMQVNTKAGLTFASALRAILRQDPDVILIGEVRDRETADIAVRSAMTGHLVFSTLHTNDAPGAFSRLQDMGVEPFLMSSAVLAVLAQRLVRVICPYCKEKSPASLKLLPEADQRRFAEKSVMAFKGKGCRECKNSGYKGRTGIHELLIVDATIRRMLIDGESEDNIREHARRQGMLQLREDGLLKVFAGITTVEELLRVA